MTKYTKAMSQEEMLSRLKSLHIELRYMVDAVEAIKKNIEYKYYINGIKTSEEDDDWIPCGEWYQISPARIYECSICNHNVLTDHIDTYKYCPNCGARMKGGAE